MELKNEINERVIGQNIGSETMENYMAKKLLEIEANELDIEKADILIKSYKQLNVRHKNIIDAQRLELKVSEFNTTQPK